jgi:hypothetical protein
MAFVLAVMALFFVARQGQTQSVMYLAFAAFLVTATLWVRGLDANWVEGREDYRSKLLLSFALGVPVLVTIVIGIRYERSLSTFILGALITAYIAAGLAVRKLRWRVIQGTSAETTGSVESRIGFQVSRPTSRAAWGQAGMWA